MESNIISRLNQIRKAAVAAANPGIKQMSVCNESTKETKVEKTIKVLITFSLSPSQHLPGPVSNVTLMEEIL